MLQGVKEEEIQQRYDFKHLKKTSTHKDRQAYTNVIYYYRLLKRSTLTNCNSPFVLAKITYLLNNPISYQIEHIFQKIMALPPECVFHDHW